MSILLPRCWISSFVEDALAKGLFYQAAPLRHNNFLSNRPTNPRATCNAHIIVTIDILTPARQHTIQSQKPSVPIPGLQTFGALLTRRKVCLDLFSCIWSVVDAEFTVSVHHPLASVSQRGSFRLFFRGLERMFREGFISVLVEEAGRR